MVDMMSLLFKLLLLPLAHWIINTYIAKYRLNTKTGDVIGVRFGDYVLNRTVYMRLPNSVIVLDYAARSYIEKPLECVFLSTKTTVDISGDLQG